MEKSISDLKPAGYLYLLEKFQLNDMIAHWHTSYVSVGSIHRTKIQDSFIEDIYPQSYWPGEGIGNHLEFALKYDGVNLGYLEIVFRAAKEDEVLAYIKSKPTGKYARRIWFFFEFLIGTELPIASLTRGNYTEALEPNQYYTALPGRRVQRQRIMDNLLGNREFCPIVRRTETLQEMNTTDLQKRCQDIVTCYSPELIRRALSYLYKKETKSSFAIEHIKPNASRTEKFIALLELAERQDFCEKSLLVDLQNRVVDPRFQDKDYRSSQSYVGQTISYRNEIIHYICPKPNDLPKFMEGLLRSHQKMKQSEISAIVHAAVISYGFVFLHPFEDGNGRIHRFLIHNILSIQGMVPSGLMFPVSAVMLKNPKIYDLSLEAFSRPLLKLIEYTLNEEGEMKVLDETKKYYQYMDMTKQVEALYFFVYQTIENELKEELRFLANYDQTKKNIQEIIDMPDRQIDLFIQLCLHNNCQLSARKRSSHFDFLSEEELSLMEQAVRDGYESKQ